jgi:GH15 family glucan-1,4-alpha-glucosidase
MSQPIENYGFIGNMMSSALVGRDGSIDWLCLPRFDSDACFAALLGGPEHGRWLIAPKDEIKETRRRYRPGTAILETTFETEDGAVTLIDFMPLAADEQHVNLIRMLRGERGRVRLRTELIVRFGYGRMVPWVRRRDYGLLAIAGPDAVELHAGVQLHGEDLKSVSEFTVEAGGTVPFTLAWHPSHKIGRSCPECISSLEETETWWREWSDHCRVGRMREHWREAVRRSLITLKALSFHPTGGMVAAATTSLPEQPGGVRNWDYRYCWIRDATLTLYAFLISGYRDEARAWREWLLRATAGHPEQLQIMYGIAGERRLTEFTVPWLPGYENSAPVRVGNDAYDQLQIDVYGELMDVLHVARRFELEAYDESWRLQKVLLDNLSRIWRQPDEGIWEVRGPRRHFTHSRLMAWVAMDRAIKAVENYGLSGPVEEWRATRDRIHADICEHGFDTDKNAFVQYYGGKPLDASLLIMPAVGFLPPEDPHIRGTVAAIERELVVDGLVLRYSTEKTEDGLPPGEGAFLACSFWLADAYAMCGRHDDAERLFEHLLSLRNDLGLLAEEYDPRARRQLGNFPQAFSHIGLVNTANNLMSWRGPAEQRADRQEHGEST